MRILHAGTLLCRQRGRVCAGCLKSCAEDALVQRLSSGALLPSVNGRVIRASLRSFSTVSCTQIFLHVSTCTFSTVLVSCTARHPGKAVPRWGMASTLPHPSTSAASNICMGPGFVSAVLNCAARQQGCRVPYEGLTYFSLWYRVW